jgi:hypothetical protein
MIDAEMYGMIPSAKTERRRSAPPEKMSRNPSAPPAVPWKEGLAALPDRSPASECEPRADTPRAEEK